VAEVFSQALGRDFKRNIGQSRDGGNDIDVGPLVVEVKRRKSLKGLYDWFYQAAAAVKTRRPAGTPGIDFVGYGELLVPLVVARQDGGRWLAILDLDDFLTLTQEELKFHVERNSRRGLDALPASE
jgi:hypothetical protein